MYIYFLLSKCEFLSDKKKSKTPKNKNVASVLQLIAILYFLVIHLGGGRIQLYMRLVFFFYLTKLFIEKSRITVFNIHA